MKRLGLTIMLVMVMLLTIAFPILAATSQDVTVTATPEYIAIANAPGTWTVNEYAGSSVIAVDTMYWSNPLGDTTTPTVGGATDGECRFTITNTSTVDIDLTVLFPHHSGGDASTNSDTGANDTTAFGAKSYFSGQASGAWVIAKNAASDVGYDALTALTDIKWGLQYESQSNAWTSGTSMTSTVNIAATAD